MTRTGWTLPLFIPVAAVALLLTFTMTCDPDVLWHLKTGQVILERGSLLRTNTFASTYPEHPWPNPEWLFQVLLALLHRGGGFIAIGVFKMLATVASAGVLYALMVRRAGHPGSAAALTALVLAAIQFRLTERPHLLSFLFFLLTLLLAERAREGPSRLPWLLPALFALWSNIHPEFVMGFLALGAVLVGDALDRRLAPAGANSRQKRLLLPALLCVPAACVNPEGYHALLFPLLHTFIGPIVEVTEYAPTSALRVPAFWIMAALTAATLGRFRRTSPWSEILLAGGMAVLGALYIRATPYFFLVAAPLLHRHATVTICHSKTRDLASVTRQADILVAAVGQAKLITAPMVKRGACVIDVGINRLPDGKLAGDVDFAAVREIAGSITPVPGGVGPMTVAMLIVNTVRAAELSIG